jgi:hypothetical protein
MTYSGPEQILAKSGYRVVNRVPIGVGLKNVSDEVMALSQKSERFEAKIKGDLN